MFYVLSVFFVFLCALCVWCVLCVWAKLPEIKVDDGDSDDTVQYTTFYHFLLAVFYHFLDIQCRIMVYTLEIWLKRHSVDHLYINLLSICQFTLSIYFVPFSRHLTLKNIVILKTRLVVTPKLDVGPIFLTRPNPTNKCSDPTRPDPKLTWNSEPDQARHIFVRLLVVEKRGNILSLQN